MRQIAPITLFILLATCSCAQQTSNYSYTRELPTSTNVSENSLIPTFNNKIDIFDVNAVIDWLTYAMTSKQPELISVFINEQGVNYKNPRMADTESPGYNNSDEIISILKESLKDTQPVRDGCLFREELPRKWVTVYFSGINYLEKNRPAMFGFRSKGKWELFFIMQVDNIIWPQYRDYLFPCVK